MLGELGTRYGDIIQRIRPPETAPGKGQAYDIESPHFQPDTLRDKIRAQNGALMALIHPLYHYWDSNQQALSDLSETKNLTREMMHAQQEWRGRRLGEYFNSFVDLVLRNPFNQVIFLAEESKHLEKTISIMRKLGYLGDIFYYKTQPGSPAPTSENYTGIFNRICDLGVGELIVGGQYGYYPNDQNHYYDGLRQENMIVYQTQNNGRSINGTGCVETFIDSMLCQSRIKKGEFPLQKIILSPVVFPGEYD